MSTLRPYCCVAAEFDGISAEDHARVCRESQKAAQPAPEPEPGALFDPPQPKTQEGGPQL